MSYSRCENCQILEARVAELQRVLHETKHDLQLMRAVKKDLSSEVIRLNRLISEVNGGHLNEETENNDELHLSCHNYSKPKKKCKVMNTIVTTTHVNSMDSAKDSNDNDDPKTDPLGDGDHNLTEVSASPSSVETSAQEVIEIKTEPIEVDEHVSTQYNKLNQNAQLGDISMSSSVLEEGIVSIASIDNSTDQEDQEQDNHLHTELNSPDVKKEKDDDSYHINVEEVSSPDDLNQPFIRIPQVDCEMKIKDLKIDISEVISNDSILDETTRRNSPRKQDIFVDIEEENTKVQVNRKKTKKTIKGKVKKLKKKIKIPNFTSDNDCEIVKRFKCKLCPWRFKTSQSLKNHEIQRHGLGSVIYKCKLCPKTFRSEFSWKRHEGNAEMHKRMNRPIQKCQLCGVRLAKRNDWAMKQHLQKRHGLTPEQAKEATLAPPALDLC